MMESRLYINSPINALLEGFYWDDITVGTLRKKGDFGIGTFNNLDGEMIALNGSFFQLDLAGNARPVDDGMKTPFATMCHFQPMLTEEIASPLSYPAFGCCITTRVRRRAPAKHSSGLFPLASTRLLGALALLYIANAKAANFAKDGGD